MFLKKFKGINRKFTHLEIVSVEPAYLCKLLIDSLDGAEVAASCSSAVPSCSGSGEDRGMDCIRTIWGDADERLEGLSVSVLVLGCSPTTDAALCIGALW